MRAVTSVAVAARRDDIPDIASLAAAYTWDSPASAWIIPPLLQRPAVLMTWYTVLAEQAIRLGYADLLSDRRAAALWLDGARSALHTAGVARELTAACGRYAVPLLDYHRLAVQHRPAGSHLQLVALAGDADAAGRLLTRRHRLLDQLGLSTYTVVSDPEQADVLTAAGYRPYTGYRLADGPPVQVLARSAATGRAVGQPSTITRRTA